jgi:hypothetical protein
VLIGLQLVEQELALQAGSGGQASDVPDVVLPAVVPQELQAVRHALA